MPSPSRTPPSGASFPPESARIPSTDGRTWRDAFLRLYPQWRVVRSNDLPADPLEAVAEDEAWAREVEGDGTGPTPAPIYRIWRNRRCLVATRREARLSGFAGAAAASAKRGWPVVTRISGGTMVPHLPESLHLSLLLPRLPAPEPDTEQVYRFLAEPVREALERLGLKSGYGTIPRSFCDGRFNLVADGRKLAGTSQRWTGGLPGHPVRPGFVLAHLTLFVGGDMAEATRAVNRFLAEAGADANSEAGADAGSQAGPAAVSGSSADPYSDADPRKDADPRTDTDTHTDSFGRAGTDTHMDAAHSPTSNGTRAVGTTPSYPFDPHAAVTVGELMGPAGLPAVEPVEVAGGRRGRGPGDNRRAPDRSADSPKSGLVTEVATALEKVLGK